MVVGHTYPIQSKTYRAWLAMKNRCYNPNYRYFDRYGGRGVEVCERWLTFRNFLADMGEAPEGMTLERRRTDDDYTPRNCCWATWEEQQQNRTNNVLSPKLVREIWRLRKRHGWGSWRIGRAIGVPHPTVNNVLQGTSWSNIQ